MTRYKFDEADYPYIQSLRMLLQQVSEEDFENEGYEFTYKLVCKLVAYINHLESYIDVLEESVD